MANKDNGVTLWGLMEQGNSSKETVDALSSLKGRPKSGTC